MKPRSRTTELDLKLRSGTTELDVKRVTGTAFWKGGANQVGGEEPHGGFEIGEEMVDASETEVELNIGEEAEEDYEAEDGMAAPVCLYLPKFAHEFWLHKLKLLKRS